MAELAAMDKNRPEQELMASHSQVGIHIMRVNLHMEAVQPVRIRIMRINLHMEEVQPVRIHIMRVNLRMEEVQPARIHIMRVNLHMEAVQQDRNRIIWKGMIRIPITEDHQLHRIKRMVLMKAM
jgi:hypothetical protein